MTPTRRVMRGLVLLSALVALGGALARAEEPVGRATASFAGGCFWCMQPPFETLPGVLSTTVGYTGGHTKKPTYEEVSAGGSGHAESVEVVYDPRTLGYEKLLDVFWHNVDPLARDAQFCDHGHQYRTAIFYHDDVQRLGYAAYFALTFALALPAYGLLPWLRGWIRTGPRPHG